MIMRSGSNYLLAVALAAIVIVVPVSFCVWPSDVGSEELNGEVTGISSYNQPKLDLKMEEMADRGIRPGAMFDIEADGVTYEDAILFDNYQGIFMFEIYVNIESDGYVSIGCMGKLIILEVGTEVKLTHSGNFYRYSRTPCYNYGSINDRSDYPLDEAFANFFEVTALQERLCA